jgi:hypothetical protein
MSHIRTQDSIYLNSLQQEIGRGGYFTGTTATTESQLMVIRGFMAAYAATGTALYLTRAEEALASFYATYGFGVTPTDSTFYKFHWALNGGAAYQIQGPQTANPSYAGNLSKLTYFGSGYTLISNLSRVYSAGATTSRLSYANVFAPVVGTEVLIEHYYNSTGQKFTVDADKNSIYQEGADDITKAGQLKVVGSTDSPLNVTYATLQSTTVAYKELGEYWPMWRKLGNNKTVAGDKMEANCASDSIFWLLDVGIAMADDDLISAALTTWNAAVDQVVNFDTKVVKKTIGALWNSEPYLFINCTQSSGYEAQPPSYFITQPYRNATGQIIVTFPVDSTRTKAVIENDVVFVNYEWGTSHSTLDIEIGESLAQDCFILLKDANDYVIQKHLWLTVGSPSVHSIPLEEFLPMYSWGATSNVVYTAATHSFDATFASQGDGAGLPINNMAVLPVVYSSTTTGPVVTLRSTYSDNTQVTQSLVSDGTEQYVSLTAPTGLTIKNIDFYPTVAEGACTVSLRIPTGTVIPDATCVCRSLTISLPSKAAHVITLGEVSFEGVGSTHVASPYTGAVPFQIIGQPTLQPDGTAGYIGGASNAFVSVFMTGYQSIIPYLLAENTDVTKDAKAYQVAKLWSDAQDWYKDEMGVDGPLMPVYNPPYADGIWNGVVNTFSYESPDPNTFWGGFQYRSFESAAKAYCYIIENDIYSSASTLLFNVSTRFADWLQDWLLQNPTAPCIPSTFAEGSVPTATYADSMWMAICLKALVFLRRAGVTTYNNERIRIYEMLKAYNVTDAASNMEGSYSVDPAQIIAYGYQHGEILEALGLYRDLVADGLGI